MYGEWILQWLWIPALAAVAAQDVRAAVPSTIDRGAPAVSAQIIRVRLAEAAPVVALRGLDLQISRASSSEAKMAFKFRSSCRRILEGTTAWEFRCQSDRIRAVEVGGAHQTLDFPSPVSLSSPAGFIQYRNRPYREEIRIHAAGSLCEVVNHLDLEKYLSGLVNSEFSSRWNEESIEAQVIAARTYALYQIRQSRQARESRESNVARYDVDATVRDQVYDGTYREDTRASQSVQKTRGMVLTLGDGRTPLKAFYHSTCAGQTELPENVWGQAYPGFNRSVPCPYCAHSPVIHWELDLSSQSLVEGILRGVRQEGVPAKWPADAVAALRHGQFLDFRVKTLDSQSRVSEVLLSMNYRGAFRELSFTGAKLREWLGAGRFRSVAFQVTGFRSLAAGRSWHFEGRGNGHGVGMCQYGAKAMGEKGFKMAAILKYYYPDAILRKLW